MNYDSYARLAITDKGTRYQHYRELLELWESGLEIVANLGYQTDHDKQKEKELTAGVTLLRKQMDVMCGYESNDCSNALYPLKRVIDQLPPASQLIGGRGDTKEP